MIIRLLVEDVVTKRRWIEEYNITPGCDPMEFAKRSIEIWNNGKSKYSNRHRLLRIRTKVPEHYTKSVGRKGKLPWEE